MATGVFAAPNRSLGAHEWGTFTVLSGSDGVPLRWFQPPQDLAELPAFVASNPSGAKASPTPALVRMETPVIYFYPTAPMAIRVRARLQSGELTEWFPRPSTLAGEESGSDSFVTWSGKLVPAADAAVRARVPTATAGRRGEQYFRAREVPDAWLFQSDAPAQPAEPNADHFIFYRGKGDLAPPYAASAPAVDRVQFRHSGGGGGIRAAFALSVNGDGAVWQRLPALPAWDANGTNTPVEVRFDSARIPLALAEQQLAVAISKDLGDAGLTAAEAAAMVATWQGHWFREPGLRVLAILPRACVDAILPLEISPVPENMERVFVARFEILTPDVEQALLELLKDDGPGGSTDSRQNRFEALQLGRFGAGALLRAQNLAGAQMAGRFRALTQRSSQSVAPLDAGDARVWR